ncbi:MAG: acyl-CoA dehydrogenase family protein, partial [Deltaproteobacteria bacterium]|nr:acyl-CoA dehydrogenase family protein [Deltaproteobacteria bacterium]
MKLSIDAATQKRLSMIRGIGESQIRPVGLEADRLGRPVPPDHTFFQTLIKIGLGRTRWDGKAEAEDRLKRESRDPNAQAQVGASRGMLCIAEEMSYWDRGVAVAFPGPGLGDPPISSMGTAEQKQRFLGPFLNPKRAIWGSFAMTEPSAGSDVAAIKTAARKDGDHWILNGAKSFAAHASRAEWIVVWATIDPSLGREGHRAFVVERDTPGLGEFNVERKMGLKAYESTSFTLRDCRVPAANLLGGEDYYARKAGFKGAMKSFNATRPLVAIMAVGIGRAALDASIAFARENDLLDQTRVRDRLERVRRRLRAARLLCWHAAYLAD